MCADTPLPTHGKHKIKIEVIKEGTMAFGVAPAHLKSSKFIDDKKGAVKYLSFSNGGGLLNYCGAKIDTGTRLHVG